MRNVLTALCIAAFLHGCITPVVPLPPPEIRDVVFTITDPAKNLITFRSVTDSPLFANSYIFLFNHKTMKGAITLADNNGHYTFEPMEARDGDQLDLWSARTAFEEPSDVTCGVLDLAAGKLKRCLS